MKKNKDLILQILIFIIVFIFSMLIGSKYTGSDQKYYREVYSRIRNYGLFNGYIYYSISLSSFEIIHFILIWIFSRIIQKDIIMSIFNSILSITAYKVFKKWGASKFNAFYLSIFNYYLLVLYFAAERLKFGILIFALGLCFNNSKKISSFLEGISIFAHIQMIIAYIAINMHKYFDDIKKLIKKLKISKTIILIIILGIIAILLLKKQFIAKLLYYSQKNINLIDIIKTIVFLGLSIFYSRNKIEAIYLFLPLILSVFIVGSFRINIFAYFVFLYFGLHCKKGYNLGIFATNIYYFYMSIDFIRQILIYGNAFNN